MGRYLIGRILSLVMVLFIVSVFTFLLMHSIPGGPFDESKGRLPEAARANIMRKYGLDKPLHVQYLNYMKNALQGDFGIPFQQPQTTVTALIVQTWLVTLQVGVMTVLFAFTFGISMGLYAAYHQNSWIDTVVTFAATLGFTVPNFVIAMWLILVFSIRLNWLPMGGWGGRGSTCLIGDSFLCNDWIMPVIAYSLAPMAIIAGYTRSSIVDVMRQDFVRTARAKGVRDQTIMWRHVFRNAMIPMVTALGVLIPNLLTGSIFIETVFRINGLGKFFVTSIFNRDYPMIMALWLMIALLWGVVYLLTDVAYTIIDPRVRLGAKGGT